MWRAVPPPLWATAVKFSSIASCSPSITTGESREGSKSGQKAPWLSKRFPGSSHFCITFGMLAVCTKEARGFWEDKETVLITLEVIITTL